MSKFLRPALLAVCLFLGGCTTAKKEEVQLPQIVLTPEYSEMEAPAKVAMEYEIIPEDADITFTGIDNSGVYIRTDGTHLLFETDKPGTYKIQLDADFHHDGETIPFTSNEAVIVVKPSKKPEKEETPKPEDQTSSSEEKEENKDNPDSTSSAEQVDEELMEKLFGQPISIDTALENADLIVQEGKPITVEGVLPAALIEDEDGQQIAVIWNNAQTQYVILENPTVLDIGSTRAQINGNFKEKDGKYYLEILKFRQLT